VETTTGPLGQGVANAVGTALGLKMLQARFNTGGEPVIDAKVYCLMGDGCMMEGVSSEASSLAGHLGLDNIVLIYDSNGVTLDGPLSQSCSEDTAMRYRAYGWKVVEADGNSIPALIEAFGKAAETVGRPVLMIAHTTIGKGSPSKAGSHKAHGSPLGPEEAAATKKALGIPGEPFHVPKKVKDFFAQRRGKQAAQHREWDRRMDKWRRGEPEAAKLFDKMSARAVPDSLEETLAGLEMKDPIAGRKASHALLQKLAVELPFLVGGSADLSSSDSTMLEDFPLVEPGSFRGRNIKFGVREFAMAAAASGISQTGMLLPFVGTFLTFSDYMRNAIRLAALMRQRVIYHFTHDSVFLGEDGPTHQAVEHLAALRAIPGLRVIRPCDANEVRGAWLAALGYDGPTALVLSRQDLPQVPGTGVPFSDGVGRGAYMIKDTEGAPDFTLIATGSEVSLALGVAEELGRRGRGARLISMPSTELFDEQDEAYRDSLLGGETGRLVSIEAGASLGWHRYIGRKGLAISIDRFGESAPAADLAPEFGFTVDSVVERLISSS
jgi:transketolase